MWFCLVWDCTTFIKRAEDVCVNHLNAGEVVSYSLSYLNSLQMLIWALLLTGYVLPSPSIATSSLRLTTATTHCAALHGTEVNLRVLQMWLNPVYSVQTLWQSIQRSVGFSCQPQTQTLLFQLYEDLRNTFTMIHEIYFHISQPCLKTNDFLRK